MNYRHIYHAGNFADVFKHIVLMLALDYLKKKDKPFFALDTHAGIGLYDLTSAEATKTYEAAAGIGRLWQEQGLPEPVRRYVALVRRFNRRDLTAYPGSPLIIREMLRKGDRLTVNELHPDDSWTLRKTVGDDARVRVESMDGYIALKGAVPPIVRRGLVLIDPPFEVRNEFDLMTEGLKQAYKRWATGIYMLWYPIKDPAAIQAFHESVAATGIPDSRAFDFYLHPVADPAVLNGCGLVIVNAPWTLAEEMQGLMPALIERLTDGQGEFRVTEITPETVQA